MDSFGSIHRSYWSHKAPLEQTFPKLESPHRSEVAIIGAGITGLSVALELLQRGRDVAIYEAAVIGAGTTGGSTGHLDASPEIGPWSLLDKLGEEKASAYVDLRLKAIDAIEHRVGPDCDFRRVPAYRYSEDDEDRSILHHEFSAAEKVGLPVHWEEQVPFPKASNGYRIDHMARIDSLAYLRKLAHMVREAGGKIFERTTVDSTPTNQSHRLTANGVEIEFDHVVCATHCNFSGSTVLDLRVPPYQSYVIAVRVAELPPDALFWDNSDSYFYSRRYNDHDNLVLIGGCDHRTGDGDPRSAHAELEEFARERFRVEKVEARWSAEFFEPTDGFPLIGRAPLMENVWVATGLSGVGLTWGTVAGWLIADQLVGQNTAFDDVFSPTRFSVGAVASTIRKQLSTAGDYAERILPAAEVDTESLLPGQGKVGNVNGALTAVCRDRDGHLHCSSPICTHLGGVVRWNEAEQTWDCPVHGGRFESCGKRLYGPPHQSLAEVSVTESSQ